MDFRDGTGRKGRKLRKGKKRGGTGRGKKEKMEYGGRKEKKGGEKKGGLTRCFFGGGTMRPAPALCPMYFIAVQ